MARPFARSFYDSKEWERVRAYCLMRDRYCCQHCGLPAQEVHHIIHLSPDNIWDPQISLNPDNLVSLCRDCHFEQHREDANKGADCADGFVFDEFGQLVPDERKKNVGGAGA